jgi:hypothetical protein
MTSKVSKDSEKDLTKLGEKAAKKKIKNWIKKVGDSTHPLPYNRQKGSLGHWLRANPPHASNFFWYAMQDIATTFTNSAGFFEHYTYLLADIHSMNIYPVWNTHTKKYDVVLMIDIDDFVFAPPVYTPLRAWSVATNSLNLPKGKAPKVKLDEFIDAWLKGIRGEEMDRPETFDPLIGLTNEQYWEKNIDHIHKKMKITDVNASPQPRLNDPKVGFLSGDEMKKCYEGAIYRNKKGELIVDGKVSKDERIGFFTFIGRDQMKEFYKEFMAAQPVFEQRLRTQHGANEIYDWSFKSRNDGGSPGVPRYEALISRVEDGTTQYYLREFKEPPLAALHFFNAKPRPGEKDDLLDRLNTWQTLRGIEYGTTDNVYADDLIEVNGRYYQIRDKQVGIDKFGVNFQDYPTSRKEAKKFIEIMQWITYLEGGHQRKQLVGTHGELPAAFEHLANDSQAITALKLESRVCMQGYLKQAQKLSAKSNKGR